MSAGTLTSLGLVDFYLSRIGALDAATIDLQEPADTTEANLDWQMVFIVGSIVFFVVVGVIVTRAGGSKRSEGSSTYSPSGADSSTPHPVAAMPLGAIFDR